MTTALRFLRDWLMILACVAPGATQADPNSHRRAAERLLQIAEMQQRVDKNVDTVLSYQLSQNPQLRGHEKALRAFLQRHIGWNSLRKDIVDLYVKEFTEAELDQMNAFYTTPTGQKVIRRTPQLILERNRLAVERLQEHIGELQGQLSPRTRPPPRRAPR